MADIEEAYGAFNTLYNDDVMRDLFKNTFVVTQDDIDAMKQEFDPEVYTEECNKYKEALNKKVNLLTLLKADFDSESSKFACLNETKQMITSKCGDLDLKYLLDEMDRLINSQDLKLKELQETIQKAKKELNILFRYSPHFTENDPRNLCPVCMSREVSAACVPCGHTLCHVCAYRMDENRCFLCRNQMEKVIKLFFN